MNDTALVVLCTVPNRQVGADVARALVNDRLAACVTLVGEVQSVYSWQGKVCDEAETLLMIKTTRDRFDALRQRLVELHPYEVPEVLALPVEAGHPPYLEWIATSTTR